MSHDLHGTVLMIDIRIPQWLTPSALRHIFYGTIIGLSLSYTSTSLALYYESRKRERLASTFQARPIELRSDDVVKGVTGLIGLPHWRPRM